MSYWAPGPHRGGVGGFNTISLPRLLGALNEKRKTQSLAWSLAHSTVFKKHQLL